jgi:hypothetical protein
LIVPIYRRAVVLLVALFAACSGSPTGPSTKPPTPLTVSMEASRWVTIGDPTPFPLANEDANLAFEFPTTGAMNYLYTPSGLSAVRGTVVVTLRVATTGPVVFNSLDPVAGSCNIPPTVRPFFWANDNGNGVYDRWWSNPRSFPLADGSATISVPLLPEFWSSVNGKFGNADTATRFGFDKAILNVTRLGLTFGGGCSFGHGVNIRGGSAQFQLTGYAIQ